MKKQYSILSLALSLFFFSVVIGNNALAQSKSDVSVSRTVSAAQMAADGRPMVVVTVTISKYAFKGPARIVETFPNNFKATLISSNRSSFQSGSGQAQFIWSDIQTDRTVAVSYALEALGSSSDAQAVTGQLFYQNQTFPISASSFSIDASNLKPYQASSNASSDMSPLDDIYYSVTGNTPPDVATPPATASNNTPTSSSSMTSSAANNSNQNMQQNSLSIPPPSQQQHVETMTNQQNTAATSTPPVQQQPVATTTPAMQQQAATTTPAATTSTSGMQEQPAATTSSAMQQQPATSSSSSMGSSGNMGSGSGDVIYRVQIIVVGDKSRLPHFFSQYGITDQKYYDPADGIPVRVMVGNYSDLNSAKARCEQLKAKGITGAFIAPYYMGQRVTVAEAQTHGKN